MTPTITLKKATVSCGGYSYDTFRLSARINGHRIRKQFTDEHEALSEKHRLELFATNALDPIRAAVTRLTPEQITAAEAAYARLGNKSLATAVDWFLATYTAPMTEMPLADAAKQFLEDRAKHVRPCVQKNYKRSMRNLVAAFPGRRVHELTTDRILEFLESQNVGKKRWNNLRGDLSAFFSFCLKIPRRWTQDNPVEPVPVFKIARSIPEILTVEKAEELMKEAEAFSSPGAKDYAGCLAPYFALALFAGLRPSIDSGEIVRIARHPTPAKIIDLRMGVIRITPDISKTKDLRQVFIRPNLRAWLSAYPAATHPIICPYFKDVVSIVRGKIGVGHDVLRHTFISMHVAKFQSLGAAALEAGNSESIIRKHYLNLVAPEDAERFWNILPQTSGVKGEDIVEDITHESQSRPSP